MKDERHTIDPEDPLVRTAVLGKLVEDFLCSDIGEYLLKRALNEEEENTKALIENAATWTLEERVACQGRIWRAQQFREWLADALAAGEQAVEIGKEERDG